MISKLICLAAGGLVMVIALAVKSTLLKGIAGTGLYYWSAIVLADLLFLLYMVLSLVRDMTSGNHKPPLDPLKDTASNRREAFRVVYQPDHRPTFLLQGKGGAPELDIRFDIIDISERGFALHNPDRHPFATLIRGLITFADFETFEAAGKRIRQDGHTVTIHLDAPLPHKRMIAEQRRALKSRRRKPNEE